MANIHLVGGEKGGVGKSVVARILAQYFIDKELPFLGFDTDRSHGSLLRFYADYASPVVVDRYESMDMIVEAASENSDKHILVAWGRDFDDVSPIKGVILGGGTHTVKVTVDITPVSSGEGPALVRRHEEAAY